MLKVGGREVDEKDAREWVQRYLNGKRGQFGYPSYDDYQTNDHADRLCDGDLLGPVLLNVQIRIKSFADLRARRGELETALQAIPRDVDLACAGDVELALVGAAFAVLDGELRPRNVKGTTLAKVLHRKRPALIPLYDEKVRRVYQDGHDAPLPRVPKRSWEDFMTGLAGCMRKDLNNALDVWDEFTTLVPAGRPPASRLRVLDIVAWRLGETL